MMNSDETLFPSALCAFKHFDGHTRLEPVHQLFKFDVWKFTPHSSIGRIHLSTAVCAVDVQLYQSISMGPHTTSERRVPILLAV